MKQIETGRQIVDNLVRKKACEQICFNNDGDSNETEERDREYAKHPDPRIST
jgi:hypothetical protein